LKPRPADSDTPISGRGHQTAMKLSPFAIGLLVAWLSPSAHAAIPAGYKGLPFDPAVAGGKAIPPTVTAGPYALPGRLDFVNYDMGGINVGYFTEDHIGCAGDGYRTDGVTPTLCKTNAMEGDVWYDTDPALDGTQYPSTTGADFYIGAAHPGNYVNITVNVKTAGMYSLSSTWASGNGPPGGEGGNGAMELKIYSNGAMPALVDWKSTFPNYQTSTNYHKWKAYPHFATVTLDAGVQVIKMELQAFHLNLSYVQFSLMLPGGGFDDGSAGAGGAGAGGGGAGAGGDANVSAGSGGASSTGAAGATASGAGAGGDANASAGSGGASGSTSGDQAGASGAIQSSAGSPSTAGTFSGNAGSSPGTAGTLSGVGANASSSNNTGSCAVALGSAPRSKTAPLLALGLAGAFLGRRRRRAKPRKRMQIARP
jgi:MYXO-CTERM domain-containing protein